ncbi:tRNA (N6-isopentenyl adenosine(37)-C2)-methylthiotransferase MiaB [Truepera radiovictrix]|nr:tRNA (N6-isopentenyl adenosine(37)-C2)-methylthiotransferase MiaB [Truepera radiovictrix]WMT55933.1 tRNA (N6-isopentenyl adenosine(37)-C2)-methylthiotransferase MiaB [Truepera radiovictrix]
MNEYDTHTILSELVAGGHQIVDTPADAELIILNTCAVRGKPVEKVISLLGEFRKQKLAGRDLTVGMMGCLAQLEEGQALAKKFGVDILVGPGAITDILKAIEAVETRGESFWSLDFKDDLHSYLTPPPNTLTGFLTIMRGCNHHCTYCIVPQTRGPEVSRSLESIMHEARAMQAAGVQEIYLLGQNVNSYGLGRPDLPSFAELLRLVAATGIPRVKFTTSHPMNFTSDVIDAMAECDNVCKYIHLPVQSGSDRVLRRMAREYRRARYLEIIAEIKAKIPDVVISTDIIVGFPGETEEDFEATLTLYDEVGFDHAYMFMYSARPGTPSYKHFKDLPREVKTERLGRLIERQKYWSNRRNARWVGRNLRVLVKEVATDGQYLVGHSDQNHTVLVPKEQVRTLGLHEVRIDSATPHTLYGTVAGFATEAIPLMMAS